MMCKKKNTQKKINAATNEGNTINTNEFSRIKRQHKQTIKQKVQAQEVSQTCIDMHTHTHAHIGKTYHMRLESARGPTHHINIKATIRKLWQRNHKNKNGHKQRNKQGSKR